ncbi:MAG: Extracellular exo-alpha-L-arabinofuranosidase [Candidatus Ordinivivax streblomastigis]|uniref:non-reducing end alpha-L-arabinofuranosidase n=1 Tax=Candidatus Ordinivivax streblomastigis TaxID=2540710 RepID=A0A5M8NUM3_9BACT|nr:MAG: Extracellular exo-alpha-L-arabinofuranosidase [Candidatus Ordinivivax streblomastigis]
MKKTVCCFAVTALLLTSCNNVDPKEEIIIYLQEKGAEVAPSMYGVFFEEINHAGDGGLYAELVENRSFEDLEMPKGYHANKGDRLISNQVCNHITGELSEFPAKWTTEPVPAWSLKTKDALAAQMKLTKERPLFASAPNNLEIVIKDASEPVSLINDGYWGMGIDQGEKYHLRAILRTSTDYKGKITAKLISEKGDVLASTLIETPIANQWNDFRAVLVPSAKDSKAQLALEFDATGKVWIDYVSLFPENTFNNRPNGLRKDVAGMIADLNPAFVRWPGGCVVEGISLENRFEWKKTLGDPAARSGQYSLWGYRCSYGFGYYELLQFCEDMNADAMFVCNIGLACQYRTGEASPADQIEYYLNDCLDAIEYALGDVTTEWGAKRAAAGHPDTFPLQYVEIGNENWGDEYDKRFDRFYSAIKKKYPQLTLISNHGMGGTGKIAQTDMIDPHWYVSPDFFFKNTNLFDNHPRGKYTVYVGEYACNNRVGGGNMTAALSEAAFIGGMERNGDLVKMASYAPLLENRNNRAWPVNLIWFDAEQVVGRSSYYVQKMAAENRPDYNLRSNISMAEPQLATIAPGYLGFGSYSTKVEYKNIKVTRKEKIINLDGTQFTGERGKWEIIDGMLAQTSMQNGTRRLLKGFQGNDYTFEFKARKSEGNEGFFIYFGMSEDGSKGYIFNIGGWNNSGTAVELITGGETAGTLGKTVPYSVETNKWYNLKIVGTAAKTELYIDEKLVLEYEAKSVPLRFFASGYDETTGELILKVVNAAETPYSTRVKLEGATSVEKIGKVISLAAKSGAEENSFENPKNIYPQESKCKQLGKEFEYRFLPFSYTILRVKVSK